MANPFDQFDEYENTPSVTAGGNPFDQFDEQSAQQSPVFRQPSASEAKAGITRVENGQGYSESGVPVFGPTDPVAPPVQEPDPMDDITPVSAQMYNNSQSIEEAYKLYEQYANHPEAKSDPLTGDILFRGQRVPYPEEIAAGSLNETKIGVGSGQIFADTARGIGREAIATPLWIRDLLAGTNDAQEFRDAVPTIPSGEGLEGGLLGAGRTAAEFATGATGALRGLKTIKEVVQETPQIIETMSPVVRKGAAIVEDVLGVGGTRLAKSTVELAAKGTVANAAGAMLTDPDVEGLVFGEGSVFGALGRTDTGNYSEDLAAKKFNILADAMVMGAAGHGIITGASAAGNLANRILVSPIRRLVSGQSKSDAVMEEVLRLGAELPENPSPEQIRAAYDEVARIIGNNREVVMDLADEGGNVSYMYDTLSALEKGLREKNTESSILAAGRVLNARRALEDNPAMQANRVRRDQAIDETTDRIYERGGGAEGVEETGQGLVRSGFRQVDDIKAQGNQRLAEAEDVNTQISRALEEDPTFGSELSRMEEVANIDIKSRTNESVDQIARNVADAEQTLRTRMDDSYRELADSIPDDVTFTVDDDFAYLVDTVKGSLRRTGANLEGLVQEGEVPVKYLMTEGLEDINQAISRTSDPILKSDLITLKQTIQGDSFIQNADIPEAALEAQQRALGDAQNYYDFFERRDGSVLSTIAEAAKGRGEFKGGRVRQGAEANFMQRSTQAIEGTVSNAGRHQTDELVRILETPEGAESAGLVTDVMIGRVMQDVQRKIGVGGGKTLTDVDVTDITAPLTEYAAMIKEINPEQYDRVLTTVRNLKAQKDQVAALQEQAKEAMELAKRTEEDIFGAQGSLRHLVEGTSTRGRVPVGNMQEGFDKIFKGKTSDNAIEGLTERQVEDIIRSTGEDTEALKGVQAAFVKSIDWTNPSYIEKNADRIARYANIVFKDKPELVEVNGQLMDIIKNTTVKPGGNANQFITGMNDEGVGAIGKLITTFLGVLDPTATRARMGANVLRQVVGGDDDAAKILGAVNGNADEFHKLYQQFVSKQGNLADREVQNSIRGFMIKGGLMGTSDTKNFDSRYEDTSTQIMDEDASSRVSSAFDETEENLR